MVRKAIVAATKKRWAAFHAAKHVQKAPTKVAIKKAAPKKSTRAKTKPPVKDAAKKSTPMTAQPIQAVEPAPTPEVGAQ